MITTPLLLIRFRPSFESWQAAAAYLLQQSAAPSSVEWIECADGDRVTYFPELPPTRWNEDFIALARRASCHRSSERWPLLYRVLWRLIHGQSRLLNDRLDPDVNRLLAMAQEVDKETRHLVHTVQFTPMDTPHGLVQMATFHPRHHVVELAAPALARQWGETRWTLLTPDRCVSWNGRQLVYTAGTGLPAPTQPTSTAKHPPVQRFSYHRQARAGTSSSIPRPRQMELL